MLGHQMLGKRCKDEIKAEKPILTKGVLPMTQFGLKQTLTFGKRKAIILAVCNGCTNTRQIAKALDMPHSTITNYFFESAGGDMVSRFVNGDLLRWEPGKDNTLRPGPNVTRIWRQDKVIDVFGVQKPVNICKGTCKQPCISVNDENPFHWCGNCIPF